MPSVLTVAFIPTPVDGRKCALCGLTELSKDKPGTVETLPRWGTGCSAPCIEKAEFPRSRGASVRMSNFRWSGDACKEPMLFWLWAVLILWKSDGRACAGWVTSCDGERSMSMPKALCKSLSEAKRSRGIEWASMTGKGVGYRQAEAECKESEFCQGMWEVFKFAEMRRTRLTHF